jgi:GTP diphosphokinase / guanosine-3',5'-bis(diphosphate) 3'-diphosphatase
VNAEMPAPPAVPAPADPPEGTAADAPAHTSARSTVHPAPAAPDSGSDEAILPAPRQPPDQPTPPGPVAVSRADDGTGHSAGVAHTPLHRRVRGFVGRSVAVGRSSSASGALGPLVGVHCRRHPSPDVPTLRRAFEVAEERHSGQRRKSGEPFITHPLAVATILADLGLDTTALVAALLHDTVEDTGYTIAQTQATFGLEVAHLVDGVTKLDRVRFGADAEAETIRKMIVAGGRDLRVLVIKLADRLHNMRTLRYQPLYKQERTARATLDVLVPVADRLGIHLLKRELEGLCFAVLQPQEAAETLRLDRARGVHRAALASAIAAELEPRLRSARVTASVAERPRHPYSAYRTTIERGGDGRELLDHARVLVVVDGDPGDCYTGLGLVHGRWRPIPGRFRDYIALPKFNMYQSLHTTVLGPGDETLDVLIRTESMHWVAEYGIAAHLREAARPGPPGFQPPGSRDLDWLRRLLAWQREVADAGEFFRTLRDDLGGGREVLVFASDGSAVTLPDGSTPVDLAYALGGTVGHRTIGAKVNGRLVPLTIRLADGDGVELLTSESENPGPSRDWLASVRTPHAHLRIQQWFAEQSRDVVIERGRHALEVAFEARSRSLDDAIEDGCLLVVALELGHRQLEELYAAVAERRVGADEVAARSDDLTPPS